MFEDRPYRQKKQSLWSIWWFVGLMASGLTAWHLELIPFSTAQLENISDSESQFDELAPLSENPIANSTEEFSFSRKGSEIVADHRASQPEPPLPPGLETQSEPTQELNPVSENPAMETPIIQQTSFEQPNSGVTNSSFEQPAPYYKTESEFTPVQTLTYRAQENPVPPQNIPSPGQTPPVQLLSQPPHQGQSPQGQIRTLSNTQIKPLNPPSVVPEFTLSPEAESDIVRHRKLSEAYWHHPEQRSQIASELELLARTIYFSPETHYLPAYTVAPNEHLRNIAKQYDVPWEYLSKLNQITPEKIRSGQDLKVIKGPFNAVIDLNDYRITIHAHGYYVCSFPIGTGKDHSSPVGKYAVLNKERNPTYYGAEKVISKDDPSNPLGEHWIDLGNGYGIHGTINPDSIGQSQSKGCIRMHNADVAQVFDLLTTKSKVVIRK